MPGTSWALQEQNWFYEFTLDVFFPRQRMYRFLICSFALKYLFRLNHEGGEKWHICLWVFTNGLESEQLFKQEWKL